MSIDTKMLNWLTKAATTSVSAKLNLNRINEAIKASK